MIEAPLAVLTHGWRSLPTMFWFPETKKELESAGYSVITPLMPRTKVPNRDEWINKLSETIGDNNDVTLIAHSCSGRSALHFVEQRPVRNLVIISAFVDWIGDQMEEFWREFYQQPLDTEAIRRNCPNIVGLYSEDDPIISFNQADLFQQRLGKVVRFQEQGHFTGKRLPVNIVDYLRQ